MNKRKFIILLSSLILCLIVVVFAFFIIKPYANNEKNKKSDELIKYEAMFKLELVTKKNKEKEYIIKELKNQKLSKVEIPEKIDGIPVTRLEDNSDDFRSYKHVTEIIISKNVNYIGSKTEGVPFLGADGLVKITVVEENEYFESIDGVLYSENLKTLLRFPTSKAYDLESNLIEVIIPDHVEVIGKYAFANNPYIEKVIFGDNIIKVEKNAFSKCSRLYDIDFNEKVEILSSNAFAYCNLDSVNLPASIKEIGNSCFSFNKNFSKITLNSIVKVNDEIQLGENCFTGTVTTKLSYTFEIVAPVEMKEYFSNVTSMSELGIVNLKSEIDKETGQTNPPSGTVRFNGEAIKYE